MKIQQLIIRGLKISSFSYALHVWLNQLVISNIQLIFLSFCLFLPAPHPPLSCTAWFRNDIRSLWDGPKHDFSGVEIFFSKQQNRHEIKNQPTKTLWISLYHILFKTIIFLHLIWQPTIFIVMYDSLFKSNISIFTR